MKIIVEPVEEERNLHDEARRRCREEIVDRLRREVGERNEDGLLFYIEQTPFDVGSEFFTGGFSLNRTGEGFLLYTVINF